MKIVLDGSEYEISVEDYRAWCDETVLFGNGFLHCVDGKATHIPLEELKHARFTECKLEFMDLRKLIDDQR